MLHIIFLKVYIFLMICFFSIAEYFSLSTVVAALNNFANITLSSLYFDITKDCLYASGTNSLERRMVVTVLEQVHHETLLSQNLLLTPHIWNRS